MEITTEQLRGLIGDGVAEALKRLESAPVERVGGTVMGGVSMDGGAADASVKTFGDFLMAVKRNDVKRLRTVYGARYEGADGSVKALAEGAGSTGGYLVPTEFVARLLQVAGENAIVRPRAYIQPMTSNTLTIPALDQTGTAGAGKSNFFGGMTAAWTGEAGTLASTDPSFEMITLTANKLGGYTLSSTEMVDDSAIALEQLLINLIGRTIEWYEDYGFLRGTGVAQPLGVLNAPAAKSVTRAGGGNSLDYADVVGMLKVLLPSSQGNAVWILHPYLLPDLAALQQTNNTMVTFSSNLRDALPTRLMGLPVIFSEKASAPGSAGDVMLCDFSYYVVGDRKSLSIASSEHYKFINDQMTWRFTHRVDGQPWLKSAITLADNTNTVSPFVYLS